MKQKNQELENETDSFIQKDEKKCMLDGQSEGERVKVIHDQLRYCRKLYKVLRNFKMCGRDLSQSQLSFSIQKQQRNAQELKQKHFARVQPRLVDRAIKEHKVDQITHRTL